MLDNGIIEMEYDLKVGYNFIRWTHNGKRECVEVICGIEVKK